MIYLTGQDDGVIIEAFNGGAFVRARPHENVPIGILAFRSIYPFGILSRNIMYIFRIVMSV
jgi:hypothetical protein